nr:hypothetical protein [uncultured Carboxylicivirga sp.]
MKKILCLTASILLYINSYAQTYNLTLTKLESEKKQASSILASCQKNQQIYSVRYIDEEVLELTIRNLSDLKIIAQRVIIEGRKSTDQNLSNNFIFNDLIRVGDKIYLITSSVEKNSNQHVLLATEIDEKGNFVSKLKQIEATDIERKSNVTGFSTVVSEDSTSFVVISSPPYHKKDMEVFNFKLFDSELKSISKMQVELPHSDEDFHGSEIILTEDHHIIISGYYELGRGEKEKDNEEERMEVYILDAKGNLKEFEISIPKLELTNISIELSKDEKTLYVNGLFRNLVNGDKKEIHGVVTVKIDVASKEIVSKKVSEFPKELIARIKDEKVTKIKSDEGISKAFRVKEYITNEDGTLWVLMEEKFSVTDKYGTVYFFNSTVALLLDKEGSISKWVVIPKKQKMGSLSYSVGSFLPLVVNNDLILLINDQQDNIAPESKNLKDVKIVGNAKKSNLFAIKINRDGSYSKQVIFDNKDTVLLIGRNIKVDDHNYIFEHREYNAFGIPKLTKSGLCKINIE